MNASVRFIVWGTVPIGGFAAGVLAAQFGIVTALWVGVLGQVIGVLPVLLSPLIRMRELPTGLDQHGADTASGQPRVEPASGQ